MQNAGEAYSLKRFLLFFTKKLRLSNPWNFKAPLLITFPYLVMLLSNDMATHAFLAVIVSIVVIIGVAGLGYLSNDLGDRKKDARIGKENVLIGMPWSGLLVLFLLFFAFTLLPWLYLPFNSISGLLLALQLGLFFLYAMPPFRLKERGVLGLVSDALYGHALPAVLAAYTFYLFCGAQMVNFKAFLLLLFSWQSVQGVRNILFHQIKDFESDQKSGTATFVTSRGLEPSLKLVKTRLLPAEVLLFALFLTGIWFLWGHWMLTLFALGHTLACLFRYRKQWASMDYRARAYACLDDFYILWLPLLVLLLMCLESRHFWPILVLHLLLFKNGIKSNLKFKFPKWHST